MKLLSAGHDSQFSSTENGPAGLIMHVRRNCPTPEEFVH